MIRNIVSSLVGFFVRLWFGRLRRLWRLHESNYFSSHVASIVAECGPSLHVNGDLDLVHPECVFLGENVHIGRGCRIQAGGGLIVGDNVHISRNVTIYTESHQFDGTLLPYDSSVRRKEVVIRRNAWIGMGVSIRPGVIIGEGAIIGLGAVVTRNVADFEIVGAAGCVSIKTRDEVHYRKLEEGAAYSGQSGVPYASSRNSLVDNRDGARLVFVCSTGRSGSQSIVNALNLVPSMNSRHEPMRPLVWLSTMYERGEINRDQMVERVARLYERVNRLEDGIFYVESDQKLSNLIEVFSQVYCRARFVWLIRDGRDVVGSTFRRGWFQNSEYLLGSAGEFGPHGVFSENRLNGGLLNGVERVSDWDFMSPFARNCWYWAYWNRRIQQQLAVLDSSRSFELKLEEGEGGLSRLVEWISGKEYAGKWVQTNIARGYSPKAYSAWTEEERGEFELYCSGLMDQKYSGWRVDS